MLSICIITLREEKYIGLLLKSLVAQTYKDFEVLVVDGNSEDKTKEVALTFSDKLNLQFIESPKRGISFQRNFAVKHAKSPDIIFFDADVVVEPDFLEKIHTYLIMHPDVDILSSWFMPISDKKLDEFLFWVYNQFYLELVKYTEPVSGGAFIYIKKNVFDAVGGFREDAVVGEDFDLVKKTHTAGFKFALLKEPKIRFSLRRIEKEGRLNYARIGLNHMFQYATKKEPFTDIKKAHYDFGCYNAEDKKFSILIPALNEEKYIYKLLDCLVNQTYKDFEVIVVDGNSVDKTKEVVSGYKDTLDLTLLDSPKRGVAFQRNYAAQHAKNSKLIFFDADVIIEPDFLEKINKFLCTKKCDVLTAWNIPISDKKVDQFMYWFFNHIYMEFVKNYKPGAVGTFICADKNAFEAVNGFKEEIILAEDFDLVQRMYTRGYKYALLKDPKVYFSVRRMNKEGRRNFIWKNIVGAFYIEFRGSIVNPTFLKKTFAHEFGNFRNVTDSAFEAMSQSKLLKKKSKPDQS